MAQNKKIRVGITHGDINGIGYEVIMKALEDPLMTDLCTPIVYGSSKALSYHRKALEMGNVNFTLVPRAEDAADGVNNLVEVVDGEVRIELGVVFTTRFSGMSSERLSIYSRTSVICSLTIMLMLSALQRQKRFIRRPIIGSPQMSTSGFGFATPSCARREPSPAAIIA